MKELLKIKLVLETIIRSRNLLVRCWKAVLNCLALIGKLMPLLISLSAAYCSYCAYQFSIGINRPYVYVQGVSTRDIMNDKRLKDWVSMSVVGQPARILKEEYKLAFDCKEGPSFFRESKEKHWEKKELPQMIYPGSSGSVVYLVMPYNTDSAFSDCPGLESIDRLGEVEYQSLTGTKYRYTAKWRLYRGYSEWQLSFQDDDQRKK
ncbi:MAG: hypothetical protein HQL20_08365 [Candidatus Omnitrophica bacterium]|nr:hypothetical protein [Candidatus Omnitrophota bacterium]